MGAKIGHVVSKETKMKIKLGMQKAMLEGRHPKINGGSLKKGRILAPEIEKKRKENALAKTYGANAKNWKGGINQKVYRRICAEAGRDMEHCAICKEKCKTIIHHNNGNRYDNRLINLAVLCSYCHNAVHTTPKKIATRFQTGHARNQHQPIMEVQI